MGNVQSYFSILKTDKNINAIRDKVADRIIITKYGKVYFDYSNTERIELTGDQKPYLSVVDFSSKSIHSNVILNYSDINEPDNLNPIETVGIPSVIFDEHGNCGIIIEKADATKKCKVLIIGVITDYVKKDFAKEIDNEIVGNFIVTSCCGTPQFEVTKLNPLTNETFNRIIKLLGVDGVRVKTNSCKCDGKDVESSEIRISLNISQEEDNIITINEDGIFVPAVSDKVYSKGEIDKLLRQINRLSFEGPYDTLEDVPKPYNCSGIYLIGTSFPYLMYVRINCEWIYVGTTGLGDGSKYYTKEEVDALIKNNTIVYRAIDD